MTIKWSVPATPFLTSFLHLFPNQLFHPATCCTVLSLSTLSPSLIDAATGTQLTTSTSAGRDATQRKTHSSNRTDGVKVVGKPSSPQASGCWGVSCVHRSTGCPDSCSTCLWGGKWDGTSQDSHMLQAVTHSTTVPWPLLPLPQHPLCLFGRE